jgi:hypothetical protein
MRFACNESSPLTCPHPSLGAFTYLLGLIFTITTVKIFVKITTTGAIFLVKITITKVNFNGKITTVAGKNGLGR